MQPTTVQVGWLERRRAARGDHRALGAMGERLAARMLRRRGVRILGANVDLGGVEVDLLGLTRDRSALVVVEVKCRRAGADSPPCFPTESAVDSAKLQRLLRAGRSATRRFRAPPGAFRIDVVAIEWAGGGEASVRWFQDCAPR